MKPAWETDEYASRRFRFRCTSAARFPTGERHTREHGDRDRPEVLLLREGDDEIRSVRTSAATFVAAAMNAVTEVGAPS
jgi:hypothetical protein